MKKIEIGVIIGGKSSEYEVSLNSGYFIVTSLNKQKYNIYIIIINKYGNWFFYEGGYEKIKENTWEKDIDNIKKVVLADSNLYIEGKETSIKLDVIFPVLHGENGEDGTIQGFLKMQNIPFVGCDVVSSAVCMDKDFCSSILRQHDIPVIEWLTFDKRYQNYLYMKQKLEACFNYPIFIKPSNTGSSVGISKVHSAEELEKAFDLAFSYNYKIIAQETVIGQEVECAVLEKKDGLIASIIGEIEPCNEFYDYNAKYNTPSKLYIPARIAEKTSNEIRKLAKRAFMTLGCSALSRVDFFIKRDEKIVLNEVNTMPGFTSISMYPRLLLQTGISYPELIDNLIEITLYKTSEERNN